MGFATIQNQSSFNSAEHAASKRKATRQIERRKPDNPARRKRLEKDPPAWLRHYGGKAMFPYAFSSGHLAIISGTIEAARTGTGSAVAAPRGEGKTTVNRGVAVYLVVKRIVRFPVLVGWKHGDAKEALKTWLRMFTDSPEFKADYPEYCQPFEHSTHATALRNLAWADTGQITGAMVDNSLKLITLPDSMGAIACRSAQGDAKGLNAMLPDGTVLRPDFVLFDDAQDPKRADSFEAVRKTIDTLENVFLGMAGPQKRLTAACACTVEADNDVSEHWLSRPGWKTLRVSRITSWPGGGEGGDWPDLKAPVVAAWDEWNRIRLENGERAAIKHYKANKAELTAGMAVSWPERYDRGRGDPDAMYAAMWDRYDKGPEVFARGQQNLPLKRGVSVYTLTPAIVQSRAQPDRAPGVVPDWAQTVIAATDINPSYALSSVVVAFGATQTAAVCWYGLFKSPPLPVPKECTEIEKRRIIYEALAIHGRQIAGLPCRPATWFIDGGGSPEGCVIQFAFNAPQICGLQAWCTFGRGWKTYRPTAKATYRVTVGEQLHKVSERRDRQWIIYNADYWREIYQRGFTGEPGAPGSCSLPAGNHSDFAAQLCREQLAGKDDIGGRMVWVWNTAPGPHDYGDCMHMAYMGAAVAGIGTGGQVVRPANRQRRRPSGVTVIPL